MVAVRRDVAPDRDNLEREAGESGRCATRPCATKYLVFCMVGFASAPGVPARRIDRRVCAIAKTAISSNGLSTTSNALTGNVVSYNVIGFIPAMGNAAISTGYRSQPILVHIWSRANAVVECLCAVGEKNVSQTHEKSCRKNCARKDMFR